MSEMFLIGLIANDLAEGVEHDYNPHKISNWLWDALIKDQNTLTELFDALKASLPDDEGKTKGEKKAPSTKKK